MDNVSTKLKELRSRTDLTVRGLADALGVPHSTYAFYEDVKKYKKPYLPLELTRSIADILEPLGIEREDVMVLAGLQPDEPWGFEGPKALDLQDVADQLGLSLVPEIDIAYSMGDGLNVQDYPQRGFRAFATDWLKSRTRSPVNHLAVARGEGDSMQPTLLEDDDILIDLGQNIVDRQDRIWAFSYGELGMIKRLRRMPNGNFLVISDNQTIAPYEATPEEMHVVGRVIWVGRKI